MSASLPSNLTPAQFTAATGSAPTPTLTQGQLNNQNTIPVGGPTAGGTFDQNGNYTPAPSAPNPTPNVQTPYNTVKVVPPTQITSNNLPPSGTLNANISTPASNSTVVAPPAVITSASAQNDLNNMQTQVGQLNQDVANHQQINQNNAANTAAAQSQNQNSDSGSDTSSSNNSNSNNGSSNTGVPSLDDQINSLLSDLNSNTQAVNQDAQNNEGGLLSAEDQNQQVQNAAYAQTASQLQAIASGTYPLSASEQQLLTATASQFQVAIQQQQMANQNAVASAQMTGLATNSSGEAISLIQNAITNGNLAVSKINAQMATSVATLQQGFAKQDFDMVQSAWADSAKQFEDRQSELQNMLSTVQAQATAQVDEIQKNASTAISAYTASANFDLTTAQDAINNAFKNSQITETQRHDLAQEAIDQANSTKGVYSMTSTGQILDSRTGQVVASQQSNAASDPSVIGNTGSPLVDANTMKTADGIPYVNGTNLQGTLANQAQLVAAQNGIPYLGKDAAAGMQQAQTVSDTLADIKSQLAPLQASSFATRPLNSLANNAETATQANAVLGAYKTFSATAIPLLKALANGASGFRITQTELNNVMANDLPSPNDTVEVASQKIDNINKMLSNGERGIFGDQTYDSFNPTAAATDLAKWAQQSPDNASAVNKTRTTFPDASPYQVMQIVGAQ